MAVVYTLPLWVIMTTVKKVVKHCKHADLAIMLSGCDCANHALLCKPPCLIQQVSLLGLANLALEAYVML